MHLEPNGLVVDFSFNKASYYDGVSQNGFLISIDHLTMKAVPVAIPAGADALITIAATKHEDLNECRSQFNASKEFEVFVNDTLTDAMAYADNAARQFKYIGGCDFPFLTHLPKANQSLPLCPAAMLYVFKQEGAMQKQDDAEKAESMHQTALKKV